MKKQTGKKRWVIQAVMAAIVLLGASGGAVLAVESKAKSPDFAFASASRNFRLSNLMAEFDGAKFSANDTLLAGADSVVESPKPDFSEMEKWYEIVRYEYGDPATDPTLYFWVKPKTSNAPFTTFCMQFLDKSGVMIDNADPVCGNGIHIDIPTAGQVSKAYVHTPSETDMEKVDSVKVYRMKR